MRELKIHDRAPDFNLVTDGHGNFNLAEFKDKKNVVLYFYPKDDTPGCTVEAKEFRDKKAEFEEAKTVVIGISKDSGDSHDKFKQKYSLNFQLGADEEGSVCNSYGTWVEKSMYGKHYMGISRDTFLINKQGKIAAIWRKVKVEGHADEVLKEARKLK